MSEIRKGDMVIIRRNHCTDECVGMVAEVLARESDRPLVCGRCFSVFSPGVDVVQLDDGRGRYSGWMAITWVTKIEPLREEEQRRVEALTV